ncbi:hypothetical protein PG997_000922 [Apiospora hydei]|uniref:Uncharacterized protein n=1 Tax=Apiospora hydei TaxID=1337664 RepID=A0ABR1XC92_9PEZI
MLQGFDGLAQRTEILRDQLLKQDKHSIKGIFSRPSIEELGAIIENFEAQVRLYWDVMQGQRLQRLEKQMHQFQKQNKDRFRRLEEARQFGAYQTSRTVIGILEQLQSSVTALQAEVGRHGSGALDHPATVAVDSVSVDKKEKASSVDGPEPKRISVFTGEGTPDLEIKAALDPRCDDHWIRRDLMKELGLVPEPLANSMETKTGPNDSRLVPQGRVNMTWSSLVDSKSTTTFLVHDNIDFQVVFSGNTSLMGHKETQNRARQAAEESASLAEEQQRRNRKKREEKDRAQREMASSSTSPDTSSSTDLRNPQLPGPVPSLSLTFPQRRGEETDVSVQPSDTSSIPTLGHVDSTVTGPDEVLQEGTKPSISQTVEG